MLTTARQLNLLQWRYLAAAWLFLPFVDLALRAKGYRRTHALLNKFIPARATPDGDSREVGKEIAQAVSIAARRSLWPTSCLRQALLYWWFMARRGVTVEIHIGVEHDMQHQFAAHAWVECEGQVLLGGEHVRERYVVLQ